MTPLYRPRRKALRSTSLAAVTLVVLMLAPALAATGSSRAAPQTGAAKAGPWIYSPGIGFGAWSNGVTQVRFPSLNPSLSISLLSDVKVSTTVRMAGVAEVTPGGLCAAFAPFTTGVGVWHMINRTANGSVQLQFDTVSPVVEGTGDWEAGDDPGNGTTVLGNASFQVDVYLNNSSSPQNSSLRFTVKTALWPWQDPADALGLDLGMLAAPGTKIAPTVASSGHLLQETALSTQSAVASLSWAGGANVSYLNGSQNRSSVVTYASTAANGSTSTVRLLFGAVGGGYSSIDYDPWVVLHPGAFVLPPLPLWSLDLNGWLVLVLGVAVSAVLAVLALRRRAPPSDDL